MILTIFIWLATLICYTVAFNDPCRDIPCTCCSDGRCTLNSDNQYICRSCIDGYTGSKCEEPCPENCFNCSQTFYISERICFDCRNGYYKGRYKDITEYPIQNDCSLSCTTGCESCTSYHSCNRCEKGYFPSSEKQCIKCQTNCAKCSDYTTCEQCKDRYFVENDYCRQCQQHCKTCIASQQCSVCELGYYLDGNGCKQCHKECLACIRLNYCISCQKGYHLINDQCLTCGIDGTCSHGCLAGLWGPICEHNCSSNCRDKTCDRVSGLCMFQGKEDSEETSSTRVGLIVGVVVSILVVLTVCIICYVYSITQRIAVWIRRKEDKKDQLEKYEDPNVTLVEETKPLRSTGNETPPKIKSSTEYITGSFPEPKSRNNPPISNITLDIEIEENQSKKDDVPFDAANEKIEPANLEHEQKESTSREPIGNTSEVATQRKTIEDETVDKRRDIKVSFAKITLKYFEIKSITDDKADNLESQISERHRTADHQTEDNQNKTITEGIAETVLENNTQIDEADKMANEQTEENQYFEIKSITDDKADNLESQIYERHRTADHQTEDNQNKTITEGIAETVLENNTQIDEADKMANEQTEENQNIKHGSESEDSLEDGSPPENSNNTIL